MKTKLTLLITTLAFASVGTIAMAGPDLQTMELRKRTADLQRSKVVVRDNTFGTTYVPSSSGKGGIVAKQGSGQSSTTIALFKSHNSDACCKKR